MYSEPLPTTIEMETYYTDILKECNNCQCCADHQQNRPTEYAPWVEVPQTERGLINYPERASVIAAMSHTGSADTTPTAPTAAATQKLIHSQVNPRNPKYCSVWLTRALESACSSPNKRLTSHQDKS